MAKAIRRKRAKGTTSMERIALEQNADPKRVKAQEDFARLMNTKGPKMEAYTISTSVSAPKKYPDGNYKQGVLPETDYLFTGTYFSVRGNPIFNFTPVDAQEFAHAELQLPQLATAMPSFLHVVLEVLMDAGVEIPIANPSAVDASDTFTVDKVLGAVRTFIMTRVARYAKEELDAIKDKKEKEDSFYSSNSQWGLF